MTLIEFNKLNPDKAREMLFSCCGSSVWVNDMLERRPFENAESLMDAAEACWKNRSETDFLEAFSHHP